MATQFVEFTLTLLKASCKDYSIDIHNTNPLFPRSSICSLKYIKYANALGEQVIKSALVSYTECEFML